MTERTTIGEREGAAEARVSRRRGRGREPGLAHDRVLALQRSAGNSAVSSRLAPRPGGRRDAAPARARATGPPRPHTDATLFRAGFFSKMWKKFKGLFSKPKTGERVESATTDGPTTAPNMSTPETDAPRHVERRVDAVERRRRSSRPRRRASGAARSRARRRRARRGRSSPHRAHRAGDCTETSTPVSTGPVAPETKKTEPEHPSPPPLAMDLASGEAVLKNAFGSMKTIVPGSIQILDRPPSRRPTTRSTAAASSRGTATSCRRTAASTASPTTASTTSTRAARACTRSCTRCCTTTAPRTSSRVVGSRFNEGATEILTQVACKKLIVDAPVCYPGESPCVQALLDAGLPLADLEDAYLNGGAKEKIADWVDANCKENWAAIKAHMEAKDWAAAKAGMAKK